MNIVGTLYLKFLVQAFFLFHHPDPDPSTTARPQKDIAVFIAIQDYKQWPKLKHPIGEVTNLAATLHDTYGFDTLVLRNPNKKAIFAKLEELIQTKFEPDAQLFLFFSGHGDFREDTKEGYFIPADATLNDPYQESYLSYQTLRRRINSIGCNHILLSIDACYSGTFDDEVAFRGGTKPEGTPGVERDQFVGEQLKLKSRLFAASGGKERTPDKSKFVEKYLEALNTKGGEDRVLSFNMVTSFLEKAYPTPYISGFGDHKGGGFIFVDDNKYAAPTPAVNPETIHWASAEKINTVDSYETYLTLFPNGTHKATAEKNIANLQEITTWELAKKKNKADIYRVYLDVYPNGRYKSEAETALAKLSAAEASIASTTNENNTKPNTETAKPNTDVSKPSTEPVKAPETSPAKNTERTVAIAKNWEVNAPSLGLEGGISVAKSAGRALSAYNMDPVGNRAKLEEARKSSDLSIQFSDAYNNASTWITRGDVYNAILQEAAARKTLDNTKELPDAVLYSYYAYEQALKLSVKKYEKSDAITGLENLLAYLINYGVERYEKGDYAMSYEGFKAGIACYNTLNANQGKNTLTLTEYYQFAVFAGLTAEKAELYKEAIPYYQIAMKAPTVEPLVWEGLFNSYLKSGNENQAVATLEAGRAKFPEDSGLLFAEINYYISKNKTEELISRLKKAIEKEPSNSGLYLTLGNVYSNLQQSAAAAKDNSKSEYYFKECENYVSKAIQLSPTSLDAQYTMGALYYNKAAMLTQEMNNLGSDAASLRQFDKLKKEVNALFEKSLPYFIEAERIDPNDLNTLIALTEIYARLEKDDLYTIFKSRSDNVKNGGKYATSYFKK